MAITLAQTRQGYLDLWDQMKVTAEANATADARKVIQNKGRYIAIAAQTGVPWFAIGIIHLRECGCDMRGVLHNGELIIGTGRKTKLVPAGRGPFATFEASALDALKDYTGAVWDVPQIAYTLEKFNGFGYRGKGIPSPYLWGGSSVQQRGKYVRDGVYDPTVMDTQMGGMTVLRQLCILDFQVAAAIGGKPVIVTPPPTDIEPVEPKRPIWRIILDLIFGRK